MRYPTACSTAKGRTARWTRSSWAIPATAKRTNAPAAKITGANNTQQTAPGFSIGRRLLCNGFSGRAEAREALRYGNKKKRRKSISSSFFFQILLFFSSATAFFRKYSAVESCITVSSASSKVHHLVSEISSSFERISPSETTTMKFSISTLRGSW